MANDLTGDYDVVAQFTLGAVDRILAAMHRGNRFPHSLSMAVDDRPKLGLSTTVVSVVNQYGEAVADAGRVKQAAYSRLDAISLTPELIRNVDPIVNWRPESAAPREIKPPPLSQTVDVHDPVIGIVQTSNFPVGVAQLQLGPPIMRLPQNSTTLAEVHTPAMIRYLAEDGTPPLSDFMAGEIVTTFAVRQAAAHGGTDIIVDLAGPGGNVHFNPSWSANSLDADDRAAIDQTLSKSLKNSFQPSTTPVPSNIRRMNFKGFPGDGAVAVMMNVTSNNAASPNSVANVFVRPDDHFALAVNGEAITGPFAAAVNAAISPRQHKTDTKVVINYWIGTKTFHIFTTVNVLDATVALGDLPFLDFAGIPGAGQILLTIPVQVRFGWADKPDVVPDPVDFDFTIIQAFTLTLNGRQVGIQRIGDLAINFPGGVPSEETDAARAQAKTLFNNAWNSQQNAIQQQINKALSADGLQSFLRSLMNPAVTGSSAAQEVDPDLEYTFFEIRPAGITLHGILSVPRWPAPDVEFDKDSWSPSSHPEYRALKSWIPGGTIQEYQWNFAGAGIVKDTHRFITLDAPALPAAVSRICLTFTGSRITASGPVFYETVNSSQKCTWILSPTATLQSKGGLAVANRPQTVVPGMPPLGRGHGLEVVAHVSPWAPEGLAGGTANFVVHFPDDRSMSHLDLLPRALAQSGRTDTVAAILCILTKEQVSSVRVLPGLMYADDAAAWEHLMKVHSRPSTIVLNPAGKAVWRHEGEIGDSALAHALRDHLAPGGQFFPRFVESTLRIGEPSPNFVFEAAPGDRLTLRKLAGRPLVILFWKSTSAPSIATLKNLHKAFTQPRVDGPLIVAIDDGESGALARELAAGQDQAVIVVPDPERQIARAYGIRLWPTIVFLDSDGIVQDVLFGLISEQDLETSAHSKQPQTRPPEKEY